MADQIKPEVGSYYGVTFVSPCEKSLRGKLIRIVNTDEGPMYYFSGRFPWSVLSQDVISVEETGPETRTPRNGD